MITPLPKEQLKAIWNGKRVRVCHHDGSTLKQSSGMKHGEVVEGVVTMVSSLESWTVMFPKYVEQNLSVPEEFALLRVVHCGSVAREGENFYGWELVIVPDEPSL